MPNDGKGQVSETQENSLEPGVDLQGESKENPELNSNLDGQASPPEEIVVAPLEETEFQHPLLKGKSPQEVEGILTAMEDANRDMNSQLNERFDSQPEPTAPAPVVEEGEGYGDDFMSPRFQAVEDRITSRLESMVAPLIEGMSKGAAQDVREELRGSLKSFRVLEPHIDTMLRAQNKNPATATKDQLENVYHMALGFAHERGINLSTEEPTTTPTGESPVNIPQHRPSSAPIPAPATPKRRALTENERILAQQFFPNSKDPEGDYLAGQALGEDEIVSPGFSDGGR